MIIYRTPVVIVQQQYDPNYNSTSTLWDKMQNKAKRSGKKQFWRDRDLNPRPSKYKGGALDHSATRTYYKKVQIFGI